MERKDKIDKISTILNQLSQGMVLEKCKRCGCMKETLELLHNSIGSLQIDEYLDLLKKVEKWLLQMEEVKYNCLGCKHCFPAVAMNIFNEYFKPPSSTKVLNVLNIQKQSWPPVPGEYFVLSEGPDCPVAVSTLASVELAGMLASARPKELCIVGKTETENIGIDKVIKNIITNNTIKILLLVGKEPQGHYSGKTLHALWENGVNETMRVINSPGRYPVLRNVTKQEVDIFRNQVRVVDMIGCEDVGKIVEEIRKHSLDIVSPRVCAESRVEPRSYTISTVPVIQAQNPQIVEMDKAGYFVILTKPEKQIIIVEHYSYDNTLLRVIEGKDAKSIYGTIIKNGWVSQLSHAAYLGKECIKAELSIKLGFKYIQDGQ
ncbi:MAG: hypothetical protein N3F66_09670 [Spirochaetes bacterium]|nr:hypothetical protein [Spirochaetota bacterium]